MKIIPTDILDVKIIEPKAYEDDRGFFLESFNQKLFIEKLEIHDFFVQDNHSRSKKNTLRGLHYQNPHSQGKLVRVTYGEVFDVAVDMRKNSLTLGKWIGVHLSAENRKMLWIPKGFAHGFLVLSDNADFLYKTTEYYYPESDHCLIWNDHDIGIKWPKNISPLLSTKDSLGRSFKDSPKF
jgi:dTDP-4-dehydrorhamnose 3,5-epimerase